MTLSELAIEAGFTAHATDREEIGELLAGADHDLASAASPGLGPDWQLAIAHNAVLRCATAALAASGYRPGRLAQHYYLVQSLRYTLETAAPMVRRLNALRKKRNASNYERVGRVSEGEAREMLELAHEVREVVGDWLGRRHPELWVEEERPER